MSYLYVTGSALAAIASFVAFLYKRYRSSLVGRTQTFRSYIVGSIKLRIGAVFSKILASQLSARRYAEIALSRFPSTLKIPSVQHAQLDLEKAYVRLAVTAGDQTRISDKTLLLKSHRKRPYFALILGEPGSGKSTLTRKLFRESCTRLYAEPSRGSLPVYLELRSIPWNELEGDDSSRAGDWLVKKLSNEIDSVRGIYSDGFLIRAFSTGQGLAVFLDGLDEVPSDSLQIACTAISQCMKILSGYGATSMTVLVTGRTQLVTTLRRSFVNEFTDVVRVEQFSPVNVFQFLQNWPFPESRTAEASRIFRAIKASSSLQEMCTNPLVLSMYVARDQLYVSRSGGRPVRLPDTRTDFYREIVNELLLFRRGEQVEASVVGSQLRRKRENALGRAALSHVLDHDQPANSLSWRLVTDAVRDTFHLLDDAEAELETRRLAIETGIFSEERPAETIRFLHLTLCEFLAATEFLESTPDSLQDLADAVLADQEMGKAVRLTEVLIFASSLAGRSARASLLERLLRDDRPPLMLILRIIHENHETSEQLFTIVCEKVRDHLRREQHSRGSDDVLRLLLACMVNANSNLGRAACAATDISVFARSVIDERGYRTFDQLFDLYLSVEPDKAIGECAARRRGELLQPARLIRALEDPDVVDSAMASFRKAPELWGMALAEAALRYRLVVEMLLDSPALLRRGHGSGSGWTTNPLVADSLYGDVLAFATDAIDEADVANELIKLRILKHFSAELVTISDGGLRQVLNIADRMRFPRARSDQPIIQIPRGGIFEVWGPPGLGINVPSELREFKRNHSDHKHMTFSLGAGTSRTDQLAKAASLLLSFDGPLAPLPFVLDTVSMHRYLGRRRIAGGPAQRYVTTSSRSRGTIYVEFQERIKD